MVVGTIASFLTYFAILLVIGVVASRRHRLADAHDTSSFLVGGRTLNFWVTALSAHASDMSNWLFMGFPAAIFIGGLFDAWIAIGLTVFMFLNWHYIAPRLRVETEKAKTYTLASFFEHRFADNSGSIRMLSSVMSVIFFTIYLSAGLYGIGKLFEHAFGMSYAFGILFGIAIMLLYTSLGGYIAVAWTDLFQGFFLLAMIVLVPLVALGKIGGVSQILAAASQRGVPLSLFNDYSPLALLQALLLTLGWGLGYFGMPHVLTKFMGIANPSDMRKSKYVGITWQIIALSAAAGVGLVSIAYFTSGITDPELVFIVMVQELFPPYFAGLILCAILAATISTIDSQMLVLAGVLTEDFYKHLFAPQATQQMLMRVFRLSIVIVGSISACIALAQISSIYELVWYAWTGLGCTFGPIMIMALYGGRLANCYGAISGMIVGGTLAGLWPVLNPLITDFAIPGMIPGFFASLGAIILVTVATRE